MRRTLKQLKDLASTVFASVTHSDGMFVADAEWDRRLNICLVCPFLQELKTGIVCSVCGCNMHAKTKFSAAKCPKGKW